MKQREQILELQKMQKEFAQVTSNKDVIELTGINKIKELEAEDKLRVLEFLVKEMIELRHLLPTHQVPSEETIDSFKNTMKLKPERERSKTKLEKTGPKKKKSMVLEESVSDNIITSRSKDGDQQYGVSLSQRSGIGGTVKTKKTTSIIDQS